MPQTQSSLIFLAGPTASGKSAAAVTLAQTLGAEIISCDSMQVYKEPCIITNKPTRQELGLVKHHFIGIVPVSAEYNVFDYYHAATLKIKELHKMGKPVIVCAGTGMYMKALLDGVFGGQGKDDSLRAQLEAKDAGELYFDLQRVDCAAAAKISPNDKRRLVRALEVYYACGIPISQRQKDIKGLWGEAPIKIFGIKVERSLLYERINLRTEMMFKQGAFDEIKRLLEMPLSLTAQKIIGLKEIKSHLTGAISLEQAKELIKQNTRNYAKRQMTWFKKDERVEWIDAAEILKQSF